MVRPPCQEGPGHTFALPRYMLFDLPRDVVRSVSRFRLRVHTLLIQTVTWTHNTSPTCDLCNANDVQDEQHALFHCTHPRVVSLQRTYTTLFPPAGFNNVSAFLGQENNKLYFFLHALTVFLMSRLAVTLLDWRPFLVTLEVYTINSAGTSTGQHYVNRPTSKKRQPKQFNTIECLKSHLNSVTAWSSAMFFRRITELCTVLRML